VSDQRPSVGRIVHYVSYGTPPAADGSQAFASLCRAAIVTEVGEDGRVGLTAINPTGLFFHSLADGGCDFHDGAETIGPPDCPNVQQHGAPFRYCACGWMEASYRGGTWHWPERV
jgi:hypothetical protein